ISAARRRSLHDGDVASPPRRRAMTSARERALLLDRDGTLIVDVGYPRDPTRVELLPGAAAALAAARRAGYKLVIVSNQSGVARGLIRPEEARAVQARVEAL